MRMMPSSILPLKNRRGTPIRALHKGRPAAMVAHFAAPLKGLSHDTELETTDPLLASILTNWVTEHDRITVRPGYIKMGQIAANTPISTMLPYYGEPTKLAAAAGASIYDLSGAQISTGYGSDQWSWVSFANLSTTDYTIMVNGVDGVWSWDGTTFVNESAGITVPVGETWINVAKFDKVLSHMNRLWFADSINLAVYYLPIQQKAGALDLLPLNVLFKRGGHIEAILTWSLDGGKGLDDALAIFSSNGEVAIYSGVDPGSDFKLVGIFRFDAPMSKDSVVNFGGDLYAMISTGFVPMTTMIRAETEQLGKSDLSVMKEFESVSKTQRDEYGWQVMLNQHTNHAICNMPLGNGQYQQLVRRMPDQVWTKWSGVPARCWGWIDNHAYFGSNDGGIYRGGTEYLNDAGKAIDADVRFAWSNYKSVLKKSFKMLRLYAITDGMPRPYMDIEVDYNVVPPTNQPDISFGPSGGADWDAAVWDVDYWASTAVAKQNWQGVSGLGRVGAIRVRVSVSGCTFSLAGADVLYELGGLT
jgi:hypothetical protein